MALTTLVRFCLAHDYACLIPAEALSHEGLAPDLAHSLVQAQRLTPAQITCLERGFALYWQHCRSLYERAPDAWFAPRQINVLLVADAHRVAPYLEPFVGTSLMLYTSDLDTHPEFVAYLFAHIERLALTRALRPALVCNLSWWLDLDDARCAAFAQAARHATRPDARVFVLLAQALSWVRTLLHNPLRAPQQALTEPYVEISGTQLYVPQRLQSTLLTLCERADSALQKALAPSQGTRRATASTSSAQRAADELCDWLHDVRAHVAVQAPDGGRVWSPGSTDTTALRAALAHATEEGVHSLHADLRIVDERSRAFLSALREPASLPSACSVLETGGGAYVDAAQRVVVYELRQPHFDARTTEAPPYHRLLLGARVMHEWGHLAHTARYLRVPEERKAQYQDARQTLGACFLQVLRAVPAPLQPTITQSLTTLTQLQGGVTPVSPEAALARKTLARVGDYLANHMAAHFIPGEEMQAYVRVNVRHHMDEALDLISELARYAYEIHYLALAGLPREYFYVSSHFNDYFLGAGLVRKDDIERLFDAVGQVLACYAIDDTRLALP